MIEKAHIERVLARLPVLEAELSDPATAANQTKFRKLVQEHAALRKLNDAARACLAAEKRLAENRELAAGEDTDAELRELAKSELPEMETALAATERALLEALLPPSPNERRNAILEIRAGTGGEEAALFAGDLFRMYSRYAERQGWRVNVVDSSSSDLRGYKDVVLTIEGEGAYGRLQYEGGGHRVQRVPVTESQGRIHTSAATVAVFPEVEEDDDIQIKPEELRIDIFCSSGPGGQSVNTTYSAVRITHLPTGLVAQSQDERSQRRNKEKALAVLKARILDGMRQAEMAKMGLARRTMIGSGDRSERVRTYNFPQNRMTDHRINLTLYALDRVIEGDLDELLAALRAHDTELRLKDHLASQAPPA
jgi:peptide chain release factor 1